MLDLEGFVVRGFLVCYFVMFGAFDEIGFIFGWFVELSL